MSPDGPYAPPQLVTDVKDCHFYHTMDVPGYGLCAGDWDLRAGHRDYLGNLHVRGRGVLEAGTASGCLCFTMERAGAEVVAFDLSPGHDAAVVPDAGGDWRRRLED